MERPHRLRHTFATSLRQGGADLGPVQALLGHASLDTSVQYFRAGAAETAAVIEHAFNRWTPALNRALSLFGLTLAVSLAGAPACAGSRTSLGRQNAAA